jgi:hypothetical protein
MPTSLVAHEQSISKIFSGEYVFTIPGYQRPYAWTKEQARDLLDDLTGFMDERAGNIDDMPPYFLGSIVLIKAPDTPNAEVVDGQQRLTTLTLLLSALRANLPHQASEVTSLIYEKGSTILRRDDHFRLTLRDRDREFFRTYVQREDGFTKLIEIDRALPDAQARLRDNAKYFQKRVESLTEEGRVRLAQFIVTRCFLVAVATPDQESAFRIFSVLNSRGLNLSATDILKSDVIGSMPRQKHESYTAKWEQAEDDLGRDEFVDLFGHIRMIYRKAKPQGTLLHEFREHVSRQHEPAELVDRVILPMAAAYAELTAAEYTSHAGAENVNEGLRWLGRLEFADWIPPALAFTTRHRNQPELMNGFVRDLERLAYSMLIRRIGTNDRIDRFSRLTKAIEAGADLTNADSPLQLSAKEREATRQVLDGPIYDSLSARARTIIVLRLDSVVTGAGATYDHPIITLEHVLPQNPADHSEWLIWFPNLDQREALVHRLGNLALLTRKKNSAASNYEFARKKSAYFTVGGVCPFPLTTQVLQHDRWTPDIVLARQEALVSKLVDHWRL